MIYIWNGKLSGFELPIQKEKPTPKRIQDMLGEDFGEEVDYDEVESWKFWFPQGILVNKPKVRKTARVKIKGNWEPVFHDFGLTPAVAWMDKTPLIFAKEVVTLTVPEISRPLGISGSALSSEKQLWTALPGGAAPLFVAALKPLANCLKIRRRETSYLVSIDAHAITNQSGVLTQMSSYNSDDERAVLLYKEAADAHTITNQSEVHTQKRPYSLADGFAQIEAAISSINFDLLKNLLESADAAMQKVLDHGNNDDSSKVADDRERASYESENANECRLIRKKSSLNPPEPGLLPALMLVSLSVGVLATLSHLCLNHSSIDRKKCPEAKKVTNDADESTTDDITILPEGIPHLVSNDRHVVIHKSYRRK